MTQKRKDRGNPQPISLSVPQPASAEEASSVEAPPAHTTIFWRVFGAAAVAVVAIVGVAAYQHVYSQTNAQRRELAALNKELRKDLSQLGVRHGEMVKKEEHTARTRTLWDTIKELRADRSDLTTLKERCAQLAESYKASEEDRRALAAEVRRLRESKTADDERAALVSEIRALRERIAQVERKRMARGAVHAEQVAEQEEP